MLGDSVVYATSFLERALGLLKNRPEGCVLVLSPCSSIHTYFMQDSIDVAFVSKEGKVLFSEKGLGSGKTRSCKKAVFVLERVSRPEDQWLEKGDSVCLLRKKK